MIPQFFFFAISQIFFFAISQIFFCRVLRVFLRLFRFFFCYFSDFFLRLLRFFLWYLLRFFLAISQFFFVTTSEDFVFAIKVLIKFYINLNFFIIKKKKLAHIKNFFIDLEWSKSILCEKKIQLHKKYFKSFKIKKYF